MSVLVSFVIGLSVLGATYEFLLKDGKLQKDKTIEGWALKIVLLLIGIALIAFPIVTLFKGRAGQRAALKAARRGIAIGLDKSRRLDF